MIHIVVNILFSHLYLVNSPSDGRRRKMLETESLFESWPSNKDLGTIVKFLRQYSANGVLLRQFQSINQSINQSIDKSINQ